MIQEISRLASKDLPLVRRKILVVDENVRDLKYYTAILQSQGHEVRSFSSYSDGWLALSEEQFDLVIVSQGSRQFEGQALVQHAMEIERRLPVLVLADCLDMGCYLEAMQLGAADYLEKPILPSEIARLIETHIRPYNLTARAVGAA